MVRTTGNHLLAELDDLRRSAHDLLSRRVPRERLAALAQGAAWDGELYAELATLGWFGPDLLVQHVAVLAEELSYALAPVPWLGTMLAAGVLPSSDPLHAEVAAGRAVVAVAWCEPGRVDALADVPHGTSSSTLMTLTATRAAVAHAALSTHVIVLGAEAGNPQAWVVDRDDVSVVDELGADPLRCAASVELDAVPARVVTLGASPQRLELRLAATLAAEHVGAVRALLDLGVTHASNREQFGRPIGSYQAVSHRLATTYVDLEAARSLAGQLAQAGDSPLLAPDDLALARVGVTACRQAAVQAAQQILQVHGGTGMTWEHPLHWWYRRSLQAEGLTLSGAQARRRVASYLLETVAGGQRI